MLSRIVHSEHITEEVMHDIVIYKLRSVPEIEIFCNRDALLHIWVQECGLTSSVVKGSSRQEFVCRMEPGC